MKKLISALTVFAIFITITPSFVSAKIFADTQGHWAQSDISELSDLGIINGYPDDTFKPDNNITRAEYVTMCNKAFPSAVDMTGFTATERWFDDAQSNTWYGDAIMRAASNGLVNGRGNNLFDPNAPITRQEAAVITYNYLYSINFNFNSKASDFTDFNEIATWAQNAVNQLCGNEIINGYPAANGSYFAPLNNITRAETAAIVNRAYKKVLVPVLTPTPTLSATPSVTPTATKTPTPTANATLPPAITPVPGSKISDKVWVPSAEFFRDETPETKKAPEDLLVFIFRYNNSNSTETDSQLEAKYQQLVFGTGSLQNRNPSINDFYKENSNGQFYYNPVLLGNNTTGIYTVHIDRNLENAPDVFSKDIPDAIYNLKNKGLLNWNDFEFVNVDGSNYCATNKQVLCILDTSTSASLDAGGAANYSYLRTDDGKSIFFRSAWAPVDDNIYVACHELGHLLGLDDLYRFWVGAADPMSALKPGGISFFPYEDKFPFIGKFEDFDSYYNKYVTQGPAQFSAFTKAILGWYEPIFINKTQKTTDLTLHPAGNSKEYNYAVIQTDDAGQYYLIENRQNIGFDHFLTSISTTWNDLTMTASLDYPYQGILIWRIDKAAYESYENNPSKDRTGFTLFGVLKNPGDKLELTHFVNKVDYNDATTFDTGISVEFKQQYQNDILVEVNYK